MRVTKLGQFSEERKSKKHRSEVNFENYDVEEDSQDVETATGRIHVD